MTHLTSLRARAQLLRIASAVGVLLLFIGYGMYFSVPEGFAIVVTRMGRPLRVVSEPGPCWKLPPPIDQVHLIDCRRQLFDTPQTATLTRDKKSIVLSTFVVWHVDDPLLFMQAAGTSKAANTGLAGIVTAAKNQELSRYELSALVSVNKSDIRVAAIEKSLTEQVQRLARERLGVVIDKIGFQRIALPQENIVAVLEKMRAERETEAGRLRAEGGKVAQSIRDDAHVKSQEILRSAREEASRISADAERQAAEVFARAHSKDPEFFHFWSSLQASKQALGKNSVLVLRSDRAFFDALLNHPAAVKSTEQASKLESEQSSSFPTLNEQTAQP